jgi:hypothetical protein
MSNMPTNFTRYRSTDVYVTAESSAWSGTDSGPTAPAAADYFFVSEVPSMAQAGNYSDFSEVGSELITGRRVLNYVEYTAFDLGFYAKPDDVAGQAPAEDGLLESFFGTKSTAGSKVTYTFSNTMKTHSIWALQKGAVITDARQVYAAAGSVPTSLAISLAKDGPVTYTMGFQAPRIFYGGTCELASASHAGSTLTGTIDAPLAYNGATINAANSLFVNLPVGVYNGTTAIADGGGAGIAVATASSENGEFTIALGSDPSAADGHLVQPILPTMAAAVPLMNDGSTAFKVMDQTDVSFYFGGQDPSSDETTLIADAYKINATALSMDFDRGITTPALTEMSGSAFADANYVMNELGITGSATILCRPSEIPKLESIRRDPVKSFAIRIKSSTCNVDFYAPAAHFEIPSISEADGVCQLEMSFTVVKGTKTADASKFKLIYS